MSSMDKDIMKIFLKVLSVGAKYLVKEYHDASKDKEKEPKPERPNDKMVVLKYG